jgi:hypothetical protein
MAVNPDKIFGSKKFGSLMQHAKIEWFRQWFKQSTAWTYLTNKGFGTTNRYDDLDSPILTVSAVNVNQATITWVPIKGASQYLIEYGSDVNFTNPTKVLTGATTYTLLGLTGGSQSYVRVTALASKGTAGVSTVTGIKTKLSAPSGLTTSNITANSIRLNWTGVTGVTYQIQWADNSNFTGATTLTNAGVAGANNYVVNGLPVNTPLFFRVKATRTNYPDSNFATVNATTLAA